MKSEEVHSRDEYDEIMYCLWLTGVPSVGHISQNKLIQNFGSAKSVYNAGEEELNNANCLNRTQVAAIVEARDTAKANQLIEESEKKKIGIMTYFDDRFPSDMSMVYDFPSIVFYRGNSRVSLKGTGIIGARRCTVTGKETAIKLAMESVQNGQNVISGMAKGIDSYAHTAAIKNGGYTVAVLGCGADMCYPAEHIGLMESIIETGLVLTEYAPGSRPQKYSFPQRNRIIAGLSEVLYVIDAGRNSGTDSTCLFARKYERRIIRVNDGVGSQEAGMTIGVNVYDNRKTARM